LQLLGVKCQFECFYATFANLYILGGRTSLPRKNRYVAITRLHAAVVKCRVL